MSTLREIIHVNVREGELYEKLNRNWVRCFACGHCCKIPDGQPGVCKVRYNGSGCRELLIERYAYLITGYFLTPQGYCPSCGASIPGRWDPAFRGQITDHPFIPRMRSQSDLLELDF